MLLLSWLALCGLCFIAGVNSKPSRRQPTPPRDVGRHYLGRRRNAVLENPLISSRQLNAAELRAGTPTKRQQCANPGPSGCPCAAGQTDCGSGCTDVSSDPSNCGGCGAQCPSGQICTSSQCCDNGFIVCDGQCVDGAMDGRCGSCDTTCEYPLDCASPPGSNGQFEFDCGCFGPDLNGQLGNKMTCDGVCADIGTDNTNCGGCGTVCPPQSTCQMGTCVCNIGLSYCGESCVDTTSNSEYCGTCTTSCGSGTECSNGHCCPTGYGWCGNACVDLSAPENCGSCGNACGDAATCNSGVCTACDSGYISCDNTCTLSSGYSPVCGACDVTCPATFYCFRETSPFGPYYECACAGILEQCPNICADLFTDDSNCGACGTTCSGGQFCSEGTCTSPQLGKVAVALASNPDDIICWLYSFTTCNSDELDASFFSAVPGATMQDIASGGSLIAVTAAYSTYMTSNPGDNSFAYVERSSSEGSPGSGTQTAVWTVSDFEGVTGSDITPTWVNSDGTSCTMTPLISAEGGIGSFAVFASCNWEAANSEYFQNELAPAIMTFQ